MEKILLIEDNVTMLSLLETLLEVEGYQVEKLKGDGGIESILTIVKEKMPALILLDVHLKNISGFDLLESIQRDDSLKSIRVIMSSGMEMSHLCLEKGADDFILKPFMPEELIGKISKNIRN